MPPKTRSKQRETSYNPPREEEEEKEEEGVPPEEEDVPLEVLEDIEKFLTFLFGDYEKLKQKFDKSGEKNQPNCLCGMPAKHGQEFVR